VKSQKYPKAEYVINFFSILMTSNEKTQNYKIVDLDNIYKFCIKIIFIEFHTKNI